MKKTDNKNSTERQNARTPERQNARTPERQNARTPERQNARTPQAANWQNRSVFTGDNLTIMRGMNSESVDLIYLDPPFNSDRDYAAALTTAAEDEFLYGGFKDTWYESDTNHEWFGDIAAYDPKGSKGQAMHDMIAATKTAHSKGMKAYLCFMAVRLIEIQRLLKPTGSVYLHCDPTASHYIKMLMDAIFGRSNYRNEIAWCYEKPRSASRVWRRNHDTIFFYTNGGDHTFNPQRVPLLDGSFKMRKPFKRPDGSVWTPKEPGKQAGSWWYDIPSFATRMTAKERTEWPTQKPLALLERIIKASSNEGDIVFDPFCGCATTLIAAEKLRRKWVGCDLSELACDFVKNRIPKETDATIFPDEQVHLNPDPKPRAYLAGEVLFTGAQKAKQKSLPEDEKVAQKRELYGRQEGRCNACRGQFPYDNMERDHITPRSKKGSDEISNIQLLCSACNRKKSAGTHEELIKKLKEEGTLLSDAA